MHLDGWKEEKALREFNHTQVKSGMNYKCSIFFIYVKCSKKEGLILLMHFHQKRMNQIFKSQSFPNIHFCHKDLSAA